MTLTTARAVFPKWAVWRENPLELRRNTSGHGLQRTHARTM